MKIINTINKQNFTGIRLSDGHFEHAREVAFHLSRMGFKNLGHKTFFVNNTMCSKVSKFKNFRHTSYFNENEFGVIFLPWSGESYVVSSLLSEQLMYPMVKKLDNKAHINLML